MTLVLPVLLTILAPRAPEVETVLAVSNQPLKDAVRSAMAHTEFDKLAEAARRAGARAVRYKDVSGAVIIVGDPFGLDSRARNVAAVEEISRLAQIGKPLELDSLSIQSRTAISDWLSAQTAAMFGCKVASMDRAKLGVDIGYPTTLVNGTQEIRTFIGEDHDVLTEKAEIKLKKLEQNGATPEQFDPVSARVAFIERSMVLFSSPLGATSIAARARLMKAYLDDVEAEGQALYDRFDTACDALAQKSAIVPRPDLTVDGLSPRDQARLRQDMKDNFASYGFQDADEAAKFLSGARVKTATRTLQIGVMLRLPDGSIEGYSSSFLP